ncbi:MAG TPA: GDP-mannose 4,6-dehydratase [Candidatus Omnitrophota bacterium]|nr:GDP-mannose 4,6-dehydratase [Candidatus Omnitrophota bacterium]
MNSFDFSKINGKRAAITGGDGFLGSNLARRLLDLGMFVTVFSEKGHEIKNLQDIRNNKNLKFIEGDLTDAEKVSELIHNQDYLFHFAWQTDLKKSMVHPIDDLKNDLAGILNILETCRKENPGIKIIFPSAVTVIGLTEKLPSNEDEAENPLSIYEANKLAAEKYLQIYSKVHHIKNCVLRLSNIFGEYQRIDNPNRGVLNFMIGRALRGEILTVYGTGEWIRDYCYVQNYMDAFILAAISEETNGKLYVLGSGIGKTFNEVVEKIKEIVERKIGQDVAITHVPFPKEENEINKRNFIADFSRFGKDTGWAPQISFDDGLERTIEFYLHKA